MKMGFIDNDLLEEDTNPDLMSLEEDIADFRLESEEVINSVSTFLYDSNKGKPQVLDPIVLHILQVDNLLTGSGTQASRAMD